MDGILLLDKPAGMTSHDVVAVVRRLGSEPSLRSTLEACGVAATRWGAFVDALGALESSEVVRVRAPAG